MHVKVVLTNTFLIFTMTCVTAQIYTNESVIVLRKGDIDSHFGYAVHLQQGKPGRVIVGAPKHGQNQRGAVFVCALQHLGQTFDACVDYTIQQRDSIVIENNLFGAAITGGIREDDPIIITAPKYTESTSQAYFTIGAAFRLSDLEQGNQIKYPHRIEDHVSNNEYLYGYAEYGFSAHAINNTDYLFGAPGYSHWKGQAYRSAPGSNVVPAARNRKRRPKRDLVEQVSALIYHSPNNKIEESPLAGYAVTTGNFFGYLSYVVGIPNWDKMTGAVHLYKYNGNTFEHDVSVKDVKLNVGHHFGNALCAADINGDGFDDLLVGAPTYAEDNDYDNGMVHVFVSDTRGTLGLVQTLPGGSQSRFGTSIVNLGKLGLSKHDAVAIGSPYEDGIGAVYVYMWSNDQLRLDSKVQMAGFQAFGYSLSKAVDIDGNNVPDFLVGDYKSNSVVLLKGRPIFYYSVKLDHLPIYSDREDKDVTITIRIEVVGISSTVTTNVKFDVDNRFKLNRLLAPRQLNVTRLAEVTIKLELNPNIPRVEPLSFKIWLTEYKCDTCPVAAPTYPKTFDERLPFNFNCKSDICLPKLGIRMVPDKKQIVVGESKRHALQVSVSNTGDPAFVCKLLVTTQPPLGIKATSKKCDSNECIFNNIRSTVNVDFELDFGSWSLFENHIDVRANLTCVNHTLSSMLVLDLRYESQLNIQGVTTTKQYDSLNGSTYGNVLGIMAFTIRNNGPSRLQMETFTIRIPRNSHAEQVVEIYRPEPYDYKIWPEVSFDVPANITSNSSELPVSAGLGMSANELNTIACNNEQVGCFEFTIVVQHFDVGSTISIQVPVKVHVETILPHYRTTFSIAGTISRSGGTETSVAELDVVDIQTVSDDVPWWIIILSIVAALIVLCILIVLLKRFHFFQRPMHDKLVEEQIDEQEPLDETTPNDKKSSLPEQDAQSEGDQIEEIDEDSDEVMKRNVESGQL